MNGLITAALFSWIAGIAGYLGGLIAKHEGRAETQAKRELIHGIMAFGGGILVAAIAFALLPEGMAHLPPLLLAVLFCVGGVVFCRIDARLAKQGGSRAQFLAMLMDFVPEAIALGAVFCHDRAVAILLALFIGAQNLPEGFNAYREVTGSGNSPRAALRGLFTASLLGPVAAASGYMFLREMPAVTASIMAFAAGGILYLVFQDIAPASKMRRHWAPPLGAVLGFCVGMVGKMLLG